MKEVRGNGRAPNYVGANKLSDESSVEHIICYIAGTVEPFSQVTSGKMPPSTIQQLFYFLFLMYVVQTFFNEHLFNHLYTADIICSSSQRTLYISHESEPLKEAYN